MKLSEIHELNTLCNKSELSATEKNRKAELLAKYAEAVEREDHENWVNSQPV